MWFEQIHQWNIQVNKISSRTTAHSALFTDVLEILLKKQTKKPLWSQITNLISSVMFAQTPMEMSSPLFQ